MIRGLKIQITPALPIHPTLAEYTVRSVRHGLADVLAWLGEDVGPKPDALTHAIDAGDVLFVSAQLFHHLEVTK